MRDLQSRILEELDYSNLTTARLSAILDVKVSDLKVTLTEMTETGLVAQIERGDEKVWTLISKTS